MAPDVSTVGYVIWGVDHAVYGPVELPTLVNWIKDERVVGDTWVFLERNSCWEKAERVPELKMFFHRRSGGMAGAQQGNWPVTGCSGLSPAELRHIKILVCYNDSQLEQFMKGLTVLRVPAGTQLTRRGEAAGAMFIVVEGELRFRLPLTGDESASGSVQAGQFFGEISLFDQGARTADISTAVDSTLLKITASDFERMLAENPDLAAPFMAGLTKSLTCRIRSETRRYRDSVCYVHSGIN